jgi:hypothetical protein
MQEKSRSGLNILIALAILAAIGAAGYFYATRDRIADTDLLTSTPVGAGSEALEGDLLTALGQLRQLKLDETIFDNPVFTSFTDYGTELLPQPKGRPNPFAPFDSISTSTPLVGQ